MREILFKAKTISGNWVNGLLANKNDKWYISNKAGRPFAYEVRPETLCQFTGLCDLSGKKIWENDIIKYHFGEIYAPIKYGCYQNCFDSQKAGHIGFYVDWTDDKCLRKDLGYWIDMVDAVPVGNVFDNPELLQEEQ